MFGHDLDAVYLGKNGMYSRGETCLPHLVILRMSLQWDIFLFYSSLFLLHCLVCQSTNLSVYGVSGSICSVQICLPSIRPTGVCLKGDAELSDWWHSLPNKPVWFWIAFLLLDVLPNCLRQLRDPVQRVKIVFKTKSSQYWPKVFLSSPETINKHVFLLLACGCALCNTQRIPITMRTEWNRESRFHPLVWRSFLVVVFIVLGVQAV